MSFAIEMFLDAASAAAVRRIWRNVTEAGLMAPTHAGEARPHVSLAIYDDLERPAFEAALKEFAAAEPPLPVCFARIDAFRSDPAVVYLSPEAMPDLLALHERFHRRFQDLARGPWEYYLPGVWEPHCTLAEQVPSDELPRAIRACHAIDLPVRGRLEEVGVVEFRPIRHRSTYMLAGRIGDARR
ncbi:MAG: 2'-5' RNA ligase family protein [Chloroflexota bacterium]